MVGSRHGCRAAGGGAKIGGGELAAGVDISILSG